MIECRAGCGACCIAISISSPIPGMPHGKPAGTRCVNLTDEGLCGIFLSPDRPRVCGSFQASTETCGGNAQEAFDLITMWETLTAPELTWKSF